MCILFVDSNFSCSSLWLLCMLFDYYMKIDDKG